MTLSTAAVHCNCCLYWIFICHYDLRTFANGHAKTVSLRGNIFSWGLCVAKPLVFILHFSQFTHMHMRSVIDKAMQGNYTREQHLLSWRKKELEKERAQAGLEPMTSCAPCRCSINWAIDAALMETHLTSRFTVFMSYTYILYINVLSQDLNQQVLDFKLMINTFFLHSFQFAHVHVHVHTCTYPHAMYMKHGLVYQKMCDVYCTFHMCNICIQALHSCEHITSNCDTVVLVTIVFIATCIYDYSCMMRDP